MTLGGSRGLSAVSRNPDCELQTAMVVEQVRELDFFRQMKAMDYPGEYGQRHAARRREAKFVDQLHANNAGLLREKLAPVFGFDAGSAYVRDLSLEAPGAADRLIAYRVHKTRSIFRDLLRRGRAPDLVIYPQLRLPIAEGTFENISPSFLVLDHRVGMYVPGIEKSFVVRDNVADPGDLDGMRREAAAAILALRAEIGRLDADSEVQGRAVLQFATTAGLYPADPRQEFLHAEMAAVERAVEAQRAVSTRLNELRAVTPVPLPMLAEALRANYRDSCVGTCIMSSHCAENHGGTARSLGDAATRVLGEATGADDLVDLLTIDSPNPARAALATRVRSEARALGFEPADLARRLA